MKCIMQSMDIRISVRFLVEFLLRSGDIDNRTDTGADPDAMQAGSRIHKKIQKSMGPDYRPEVALSRKFEEDGISLTVEGRADGIEKEENGFVIDEIKGIFADPDLLKEPRPLHLSQVKCYAAMFAEQENLREITCQVTYCDLTTDTTGENTVRKRFSLKDLKKFRIRYTAEELETWFRDLVKMYFRWARFLDSHRKARNASASGIGFPYAYRPGQKETAVDVYRAILRSRNLFIQAPTGVGKTLSTLYPSVRAIGEGLTSGIFYLTAKTVTGFVAQDAFLLMEKEGLDFKTVTITAKEKACLNSEFDCNPDSCPYAKGHFDRVNDAVFEILQKETVITRQVIETYAEKWQVCPYEFSLDIAVWCDAVICDYNYVFDPRVKLKRFFSENGSRNGKTKDYIFLIDEAHNLISRASEMFSAEIVKEDILNCKKKTAGMDRKLTSALTECNREMLSLKRNMKEAAVKGEEKTEILPGTGTLEFPLLKLDAELSKFLENRRNFPDRKEIQDFFFRVREFLDICSRAGDGYRIYAKTDREGRFSVKLLCVDPSSNLGDSLSFCRTAVFFSATLLPVDYYKELLTGNREEYAICAPSPFDPAKRLLAVGRDVTSRYARRNDAEYRKISDYIRKTVSSRTGNYICFFPSYEFMEKVSVKLKDSGFDFLVQSRHMMEEEREAFLAEFGVKREKTLVGLCVMGGIFAEGIDLANEKLIGAVIVGTGLPMINPESEMAKDYFDGLGKPGFDYAYRFPGMNKVMQAAGRVIRTVEDTGVILLLDDRFLKRDYRSLFPAEWNDAKITDIDGVSALLRDFWDSVECP